MKKRGGKRKGAGRKPQGKAPYTVTLTAQNVERARERGISNLSAFLDLLLTNWLRRH